MTTITATAAAWDAATFESFLESRVEPQWLTKVRLNAWEAFQSMAWPSRNQEEWMRSDLRGFHLDRYKMQCASETTEEKCPRWLLEDVITCGQLSTLDGRLISEQLSEKVASQGVYFGSLERACQTHSALVEQYLFKTIDPNADRFAALQAATWSSGCFLHVPKGVSIEQPFHVHSGMTDGGTDVGHVLIVLEENASATVLFECSSVTPTADGFHCGGLEIVIKPGATLRLVKLQEWGDRVWHFAQQRATVDEDASIQWTLAAMGARFVQVAQQVSLIGERARSQVNGTMFTRGKQQMTYNTLQFHEAPACKSDFLYKSALQDKSRTVWRGMIKVAPGADKTDGYQRNDNLLLSDQARADSIPGLEIKADDVRCTHGSTSGRVDEELIFYAQSRGFTRQEAVRMIVTGFFQQIFDRITIDSVRKALGLAIARQVRQYD
jgi:Fe-S cluster assembly protein SufD